jgi:hypothetical protein
MKHTLPGQLDLPETPERPRVSGDKVLPVQLPCDVGLFSDESDQLDLMNMFAEPEHD